MRHALRVTRKAVFLFALFTVVAVWSRPVTAQPAQAQSQDRQQEIQQLKDKLQQMNQMMGEVKVGNRRSGGPLASTTAFLQKLPNACCLRC